MSQTPEELGQKIKAARERDGEIPSTQAPAPQGDGAAASGRAFRAGTDLVAGVVVGTFLGYWLDRWLGTLPLFMIIMFFLGFAAGFLNIYRSQTGKGIQESYQDHVKKKEDK